MPAKNPYRAHACSASLSFSPYPSVSLFLGTHCWSKSINPIRGVFLSFCSISVQVFCYVERWLCPRDRPLPYTIIPLLLLPASVGLLTAVYRNKYFSFLSLPKNKNQMKIEKWHMKKEREREAKTKYRKFGINCPTNKWLAECERCGAYTKLLI